MCVAEERWECEEGTDNDDDDDGKEENAGVHRKPDPVLVNSPVTCKIRVLIIDFLHPSYS